MQLRNNLYTVTGKDIEGTTVRFAIQLNPSCFIYQAHFPSEPITPGVCIVQIGLELLEDMLHQSLEISMGKNVKFLSPISPEETTSIEYEIGKMTRFDDGTVKAQIVVSAETGVKAKISLVCKEYGD